MAKPLLYYETPANDNQLLFNLQYRFRNGDKRALDGMYKKLKEMAYKIINNRSKNNKFIANMAADEREQKAHDAATYIIEQFIKREEFNVTESENGFVNYLYARIQWELYGNGHQRKCDQMIRYTDELPEQKETKKAYRYIVKNLHTGESAIYSSAAELYQNPTFRNLRKKRLVESIRTGRRWKNYTFDILEVNE